VSTLIGVASMTTDLEIASAAYERQMAELVAADDDMAEYVQRIEEQTPERPAPLQTEDLGDFVADVERFLREQEGD
jgi:hypothetical protein